MTDCLYAVLFLIISTSVLVSVLLWFLLDHRKESNTHKRNRRKESNFKNMLSQRDGVDEFMEQCKQQMKEPLYKKQNPK